MTQRKEDYDNAFLIELEALSSLNHKNVLHYTAKRPMDIGKKGTWAQQEDEGLHPSNAQSKEGIRVKEHEPKSPHILHAVRDKN